MDALTHRTRIHQILDLATSDQPPPLSEVMAALRSELVRLHLERYARRLAQSDEPRGPGGIDHGVTAVATLLRAGRQRIRAARDRTPFEWLQ